MVVLSYYERLFVENANYSRRLLNKIIRFYTMLTNEEKRLTLYNGNEPTIPSEVTQDTPLDSLNLNWTEKELPERLRTKHIHRLHPYLGKFIPQLVEIFLRKFFKPNQTVLDPFCGSGTTLVQAKELGINAIGYDISAFNVILCRAKTQNYDIHKMEKEVNGILERVKAKTQIAFQQKTLFGERVVDFDLKKVNDDYLKKWYAPKTLFELLTYRDLIENGNYEYKDLLKVILSRSARSARLTTHFDLDFPKKTQTEPYYCYKHSRTCHPTTEAFKFIKRYSIDTIRRIKEYSTLSKDIKIEIYHADSRKVKFPEIDGVFTSPPYVGLINYHDQHAYAYHLFNLEDNSDLEIGAASNGSSNKAKESYKQGIIEVFTHILEALKSNGRIIVVANDNANLYEEIASKLKIETEKILKRHVNRRTGRRSSEFFESIFIWRKINV